MKSSLLFMMICCLLSLTTSFKVTYQVISGRIKLRRVKDSGGIIIKCRSAVYKVHAYLIAITFELFMTHYFIKITKMVVKAGEKYETLPHPTRYTLVVIVLYLILISLILNIIIHTTAIFREKYGYLTGDGLIYFLGQFSFGKCRFVWEENNADTLSNVLHIYKDKDKLPFTVIFDEKTEEAHKLINNY